MRQRTLLAAVAADHPSAASGETGPSLPARCRLVQVHAGDTVIEETFDAELQ